MSKLIGVEKTEKPRADKTEKVCAFIEEAKYRGISTPAHKYEPVFVRFGEINYLQNVVDPEQRYARIHKSKHSRGEKITKDPNKPAPGDYNTIDAFNKTQTTNFNYKIGS